MILVLTSDNNIYFLSIGGAESYRNKQTIHEVKYFMVFFLIYQYTMRILRLRYHLG